MHVFSPESAWKLELPWRYEILPPDATLRNLGLDRGMTIVDVGAGTGFFARAAAAIVGETGRVVATDISHEMLTMLRSGGLPANVEVLHTDAMNVPCESAVADIVLAAFVAHEAPELKGFLNELLRVVKPGGVLAVIEWTKQDEEHGPPTSERLAKEDLLIALGGYEIVAAADINTSHYAVRVRKNGTIEGV